MKLNPLHIACIIAIIQALIISVYLLTDKRSNRLNRKIFAAWLFVYAIVLSCSFLVSYHIWQYFVDYHKLLFIIGQISLLAGPLFYLYILSSLNAKFVFKPYHLIHLLPLLLISGYVICTFVTVPRFVIWGTFLDFFGDGAYLIQNLIYFLLTLKILKANGLSTRTLFSNVDNIPIIWIRFLIGGYLVIWIAKLQSFIFWIFSRDGSWCSYTATAYFMAAFIFLNTLLFLALRKPEIFAKIKKYGNSILSEADKKHYKDLLIRHMLTKKPNLNMTLNLTDLANQLAIPARYLSQVINESFHQNFYDFINSYRIEECRQLFRNPLFRKRNILEIAYESGFNTKRINMKNILNEKFKAAFIGTAFLILTNSAVSQVSDGRKYVGQTPPGDIPVIFAPGRISLENRLETYPTFSPDGKKMFFTVVNASWTQGKIYYTQEQNGSWTQPAIASFSNNNYINWESFISPDGNRQFFASNRPPSSDMDIWMIEKISDSTWSEPIHMSSPINSSAEDGSACVTNGGTLYFKSSRGGGSGGSWLYRAKLANGTYSQVENLGNLVKTGAAETEPFMAPDESYLIFTSQTRSGGRGGWDLWICFQNPDNSWTKPMNLGTDINTAYDEYGPRVTPDGKYLFFTRENRGKTMDIYWVSSSIISNLKTSAPFSTSESFEQNIQIYPIPTNGKFNITFGQLSYKNASVKITDIDGRYILSNTYSNLPSILIDLTGYPKGIYILSLTVDGERLSKKIILE